MEQSTGQWPFQRRRTPYGIVLRAINLYLSGMSLRQVAKELEKLGVKRSHEAVRRWLKKLGKAARQTARKKRSNRVASLPRLQPPKSLRKAAEKLYESLEEAEAPSLLLLKRSLTAKQALSLLSPKHNAGLFPSNWCALVRGG